jgi:hypothetical protein
LQLIFMMITGALAYLSAILILEPSIIGLIKNQFRKNV